MPQADPATWWGTRAASLSAHPVRPADQPVPLSASTLSGLMTCPTQHFLSREAGGVSRSHQSANLGQIVHALAERVGTGELEAGPDDADLLMEHVDAVWRRLEFRTPWAAAREHDRVRSALARFLAWHHSNPRTLVGTEARFATVVELADGEQVRLGGYVDRLEVDHDGRVVVVDLKTGRTKPSGEAVQRDSQLAPLPARGRPRGRRRGRARRGVGRCVPRAARGRSTTARRPSSSARTRSPTTRPSATSCTPPCPSPPATCAVRSSPPSPETTARTAPTSRCARPRAPGRW